jgi:hypothetical protein
MGSDQIKVVHYEDRLPWLETVEPDDPPVRRSVA